MSLRDLNVVNPRRVKRIAMVIANPATSTTTGWSVGFWWSELTHPYLWFSEQGTRSISSVRKAAPAVPMR
jgi:hypothetical protein